MDYWTGASYTSAGQWFDIAVAEPAGGPLLVKAGAIIPLKPVSSYLEQEPADLVVLDIYPGDDKTMSTLYDDDGRTYAYEDGGYATTTFTCQRAGELVHIGLGQRQGDNAGVQGARAYLLCVHAAPVCEVVCDGAALPRCANGREGLLRDGAAYGWAQGEDGLVWIKLETGWRLDSDQRGAADPERDTLVWTSTARPASEAREVVLWVSSTALPSAALHTARPYPLSPTPPLGVNAPPDHLHVVANPPERIALKWGDWLPHATNFYVSLRAGDATALQATNLVRMDVFAGSGALIRSEEKTAQGGRVEFLGVEYKPGEWTFRFSSDGLRPCSIQIRPSPPVLGQMFGPPV